VKRVSLFLAAFVVLVSLAYWWEEKGAKDNFSGTKEVSIYDAKKLGTLEKISFTSFSIKVEKEEFFLENGQKLDKKKVEKLLSALSDINIRRELKSDNIESYIKEKKSLSFSFEHGVLHFYLGEKLEYSREFYMLVKMEIRGKKSQRLVIAYDRKPAEGIYFEKDEKTTPLPYKRFRSWFFKDKIYFEKDKS